MATINNLLEPPTGIHEILATVYAALVHLLYVAGTFREQSSLEDLCDLPRADGFRTARMEAERVLREQEGWLRAERPDVWLRANALLKLMEPINHLCLHVVMDNCGNIADSTSSWHFQKCENSEVCRQRRESGDIGEVWREAATFDIITLLGQFREMICSPRSGGQANPAYTADTNMCDVQAEAETLRENIRKILTEELPGLEAIGKAGDSARFKVTADLELDYVWKMLAFLQDRFRARGEISPLPEKIDAKSRLEAEQWLKRALAWLETEMTKFFSPAQAKEFTVVSKERNASDHLPAKKKPKRSFTRGEGQIKLIAALTKHHQYADGGCLNQAPIGNNELAKIADVSTSTASAFFDKEFGGYANYTVACNNSSNLIASLKLLNKDFSPHQLFGRRPPNEGDRDDDYDE